MKLLKIIFISIIALFICMMGYIELVLGLESKHVLFPHIDTVFPENFEKDKFSEIAEGMSVLEVESIIGKPLKYTIYKDSTIDVYWNNKQEEWSDFNTEVSAYYSLDGKWKYGDFAWEGFILRYDSMGVVTDITNRWFYD